MKNKFVMSQKENIFLAKRLMVDVVYKSANLEGIEITFANTVDILNYVNVGNLKPSEIGKVFDLGNAWRFILQKIDAPVDLAFLQELHEIIAKTEAGMDFGYSQLGRLRNHDVLISGTSWRPEMPDAEKLHTELQEILKISNATERAITVTLWIMRKQIFIDGNKRIATMTGNKILIQNGNGILSVPVELDGTFKTMLIKYYETGDMRQLKEWIYDNCIDGINTNPPKEIEEESITAPRQRR